MTRSTLFALALLGAAATGLGCDKKPASLALEPREFLPLEKKGKTVVVKAQTKDDRNVFIAAVQPSWASKDESVATVDAQGTITATGTGATEIVATHEGLTAILPITVRIVGSVEVEPNAPQKLRMGKSIKVKVTVKDDKGQVMPAEKFQFKTVGYAVDADPDGTITAQATGETTLVVLAKDKEARVKFEVTE